MRDLVYKFFHSVNGDLQTAYLLKGGTPIPAGADLKSDVYKVPGNYYCDSTSSVNTLINCPANQAFALKVEYANGTAYPKQIFREYSSQKIIVRTLATGGSAWEPEVSYVRNSDLGIIIKNSGSTAAIKDSEVQITTITLPAGHRYLILAQTNTNKGDNSEAMNCTIRKISGTINSAVGLGTARAPMNYGGGCGIMGSSRYCYIMCVWGLWIRIFFHGI